MRGGVSIFRLTAVILLALAPVRTMAQDSSVPQDLTAEQLVAEADSLFSKGDYVAAALAYQQFLKDYSQAPEAREIIRRMRYPLVMCLIQTQKFPDALVAITEALNLQPALEARQCQELIFWQGVCEMQSDHLDLAQKGMEKFLTLFPAGSERSPISIEQFPAILKIPEAKILIGTVMLLQKKNREAAAYFKEIKPGLIVLNQARVTVLELYALMQGGESDRAMDLISDQFPHLGDMPQLVTFQTLTLELGSRYLDQKQFRKAIVCLQRVWTSRRLLKHQQERLEVLESKLAAANANPKADPYSKFLFGQLIAKVKREIESFQKVENFDSALRLRLASAYQSMKRYREAALIMEAMLAEMPADKIVESASVNLVQCWSAVERWPAAIAAGKAFAEKFPKSPQLPLVRYLQAIAQQKAGSLPDAIGAFEEITRQFPNSEFSPRAQFMKGFALLQNEQNTLAIEAFEEFSKNYPKHELSDAAAYWRGMGFSLDKQYGRCREVMDEYLSKYKDGRHVSNAVFRKAYCAQQMENFSISIGELNGYLQKYPGHEENSEARILLGDALMNEGRMEDGISAFKGIQKEDVRFYEEGVFKVGKAYKLMEDYSAFRNSMERFQADCPWSPRVAEAIYNIGWVHRQENNPDAAREIYWKAINQYGDDAEVRSIEDLFPALVRLHKGDEEMGEYWLKLKSLHSEAEISSRKTLALRALWAQANFLKKTNPPQSREILLNASALVDVQVANPLLLADCADALIAEGREEEGEKMWRNLIKWNPRAPQKDRALAALGLLELQRGNEKSALEYFDRFERETMGSVLFGRILLAKAGLQERKGMDADAIKTHETLLANESSGGQEKAEALFHIAEIYMKEEKPEMAVPYFQRIYVMHGKWRIWVAKAYLRSGEAFEKLHDTSSARRTYQELIEREELADFQETSEALNRLNTLGGPLLKTAVEKG